MGAREDGEGKGRREGADSIAMTMGCQDCARLGKVGGIGFIVAAAAGSLGI